MTTSRIYRQRPRAAAAADLRKTFTIEAQRRLIEAQRRLKECLERLEPFTERGDAYRGKS